MSVLCSACGMRPAHRVWGSGRGKCGDCYARDPSEPKAQRTQKLGAELEEIRRRVAGEKRGGEGSGGTAPVAPGPLAPMASGLAAAEANKEAAMPKLNAKREAILADARTGQYGCKELAGKHGVTYASVYAICGTAKVKLPNRSGVQARAQTKGKEAKGRKVAEPPAALTTTTSWLARRLRGRTIAVWKGSATAAGEVVPVVPLTARTSALLWSGVASLPLAEQAELLRKLEL